MPKFRSIKLIPACRFFYFFPSSYVNNQKKHFSQINKSIERIKKLNMSENTYHILVFAKVRNI